jgi:hypothetical protein
VRAQLTSKFLLKALIFGSHKKPKQVENPLRTLVAKRLEGLVRELSKKLKHTRVTGDLAYYTTDRDEVWQMPDCIVIEKYAKHSVTTLVETKLKVLKEVTTGGDSFEALISDMKIYSEVLEQSIQFLYNIEKRLDRDRTTKESLTVIDEVLLSKWICTLGICPELPPLFTFKTFRDLLREELEKKVQTNGPKLRPEMLTWFREKYARNWYWNIIGLEEFEYVLTLPPKKRDLGYLLRRHLVDCGDLIPDISRKRGFKANFRSYLIKNFADKNGTIELGDPVIKRAFNEQFEQMVDALGLPRTSTED